MADYVAHTLEAQVFGDIILLDAIVSGEITELFFHHSSVIPDETAAGLLPRSDVKSVGNAAWVTGVTQQAPVTFNTHEIALSAPEPELMRGRNVALSTRNGESARTVLDWLRFHITHQPSRALSFSTAPTRPATPPFAMNCATGLRRSTPT